LHNEELRDLYSSPSIIRIIKSRRRRWAGHVARIGEKRNTCRLLVQKPEGKKPLLGDNIDTIKKNTENSIDATKEIGPETNIEKTKFMLLSHHQCAGQNPDIKIANKTLENVT
jgi:hypothetical protein